MESYIPPYTITDHMLALVSAISEKVGKITDRKSLESKPQFRKNNRILSIHSSLKIEANSLSLDEVRDVLNGRLVLGDQKEIQEVKNAYSAYEKIGEIDPTSIEDLKRLHRIMTARTLTGAGEFRTGNEGVFAGEKYDLPYTAYEIMAQLGLKSKETFRKNYLGPAIRAGLVKMTLPDKPKSKNQRYIKQ